MFRSLRDQQVGSGTITLTAVPRQTTTIDQFRIRAAVGVGVAVVAAVAAHAMDAPTLSTPVAIAAAFGPSTAAAVGLAISPTTVAARRPRTTAPEMSAIVVRAIVALKAATVTRTAPAAWTAVTELVEAGPAAAAQVAQQVAAGVVAEAGAVEEAAVVVDAAEDVVAKYAEEENTAHGYCVT
jgi:hypothetical protein